MVLIDPDGMWLKNWISHRNPRYKLLEFVYFKIILKMKEKRIIDFFINSVATFPVLLFLKSTESTSYGINCLCSKYYMVLSIED